MFGVFPEMLNYIQKLVGQNILFEVSRDYVRLLTK